MLFIKKNLQTCLLYVTAKFIGFCPLPPYRTLWNVKKALPVHNLRNPGLLGSVPISRCQQVICFL